MTYADKRRQRWERLKLTTISKTFLSWVAATLIFIFFVGVSGWGEWLAFTAAICGITGYRELKGSENVATPTYPDGGP